MSCYKNYVDEELIRNFGNLRVSNIKKNLNRRTSKTKKAYDENYFPITKAVKIYNRGNVRKASEDQNNAIGLIQISRHDINGAFLKVVSPILDSFNHKITIQGVYKVCNRFLKRQYELKKKEKQRFGSCKEVIMYHATLPENVTNIYTHNFNWRYSGKSRGSKYGFGVSFTKNPKFAHQFCKSKKLKVVFVSKVLICSTHIGSPDLDLPNDGYDTTCSPKKTVYVKFEDSEFYPDYVVYYHY